MLLVFDIGNSNLSAGFFDNGNPVSTFRFSVNKKTPYRQLEKTFSESIPPAIKPKINAVAVSSVVPPINTKVEKACKKIFKISPVFIDHTLKMNISFEIDNVEELGTDRAVNASAAYSRYKRDLIVVDFGTASTFDCITGEGKFLGGLIVPGLKTSYDALIKNTSRLPEVNIELPERVIGKNTKECIQSGVINGYFSLTDGLISKLASEMKTKPYVIATGGFAELMFENCRFIDEVDKNLTLRGICIVYELNS